MSSTSGSVDPQELAKFDVHANEWWDPRGPLAPLHAMNPARLAFIREAAEGTFGRVPPEGLPLAGQTVLDVGCGGGLLAEPLARLGGTVTGIDLVAGALHTARRHAAEEGLEIAYRLEPAEALAAAGERFDLVVASEVIEHVEEPTGFVATLGALTAPGGLLVITTLNRTPRAFVEAIVGAEYLLGWLPRGTHRWQRFVKPAELAAWLRRSGFAVDRLSGMGWNPARNDFELRRDVSVNYLLAARRLGD
ncbi:MAG: bifunctional 2-polyprenyl-6-hydroxyphenol methylase/3-demethylubiquinol 3-O-methyltransferase UbiG [Geminicoccaceae bacterium]|nr:MAG: bifunctional 2-polyprenyl-6-hydroxyphenol methylase/3-demethylubiquinol 3-O-methyltransferase UbiG [Geminicoccaceae bacterium]